jgi:cardiolipin synthase A/B
MLCRVLAHDAAQAWLLSLKVAGIFFWAVALALVPLVLVRRKEPSSTIAWILALVFLPAVGTLLFLLFGRDRVRWPAKRKRELDAVVRAQLEEARKGSDEAARISQAPEPASPLERALFRLGAELTHRRATEGNKVDVLTDGNATYDALGAAIDAAKHHVHAQYYLIRDDATGAWFRDRLVAAAQRGVAVRLLLDGFGCFALGASWKKPLRKAGAKVGEFLPMRSVLLQPVNLRNHRKIVVVDGELAFTGGFNVGDEYRGQMAGVGAWRDVHLRIEGPAAGELQRVFFQDWAFATGEAIPAEGYFPATHLARGTATVAIVPSGPDTRTEAIHRLFFGAIAGAEREVLVTTPYFVPTESLVVAMEVAAMRGVDIKLVLPMPGHSNHTVTMHAGRSFYTPLLEAGVNVLEYELGMVHAKTLVADRQVSLVGSANMDLRSFRLNFEIHALVHDAATAGAVCAAFKSYEVKSQRVALDAWNARSWTLKLKEGAARLVSPML